MLRIVLVEDEIRSRKGLKHLIEKHPDLYKVAGEADNGIEGYNIIKETMPDVVISDIKMPFCDGIEMLKNLRSNGIGCRCILLTGHADFEYAKEAIRYRVDDYILKPMVVTDILNALEKIQEDFKKEKEKNPFKGQIRGYLRRGEGNVDNIIRNINMYFNTDYIHMGYILVYMSRVFKKEKNAILNIINKFCNEDLPQSIVVDLNEQSIFIININNETKDLHQTLANLNSKLNGDFNNGVGVLYTNNSYVNNILEDYKHLEENLILFLSKGTKVPICINKTNKYETIKKSTIIELEKNFIEKLYGQDYKQCMDIIYKLINKFEGYECDPSEILHLFHSLFNLLNQYIKEINYDITLDSYAKLIGELSLAKTPNDIIELFKEVLCLLEEEKGLAVPFSLLIQKTITKINNDYMNAISLKEIASGLGVTDIYLSQLFHKEVKKSFIEYLIDTRMSKAKELLRTTNLKIYEIALKVGYNDSGYFCTQFKKYTGLSPSKYQQSELESSVNNF